MKTAFKTVVDFMRYCGPEVCGHEIADPPETIRPTLERFADGLSMEAEREQVFATIAGNEQMISWVAQRVKRRRGSVRSRREGEGF
jgi:hypothetical protein